MFQYITCIINHLKLLLNRSNSLMCVGPFVYLTLNLNKKNYNFAKHSEQFKSSTFFESDNTQSSDGR